MVALLGATPIIADVHPDSFNLDPASCERAVVTAKRLGLKPRVIIPVDLFGLPADHDTIATIAATHDLLVLDDAAQAFGAQYRGKRIGTLAAATATSFFPAKPLGCYGDGGAVFTDDDALAARVKSIRLHGEGVDRSEAARIGITGRLDTIQAAVLIEKLKIFPAEIEARNLAAARYSAALADLAMVPRAGNESTSVWAQYTIRVKAEQRNALTAALKAQAIPAAIYYTRPLHRQPAYRHFPLADGGVPVSDQLAEEVLSLPMHAYLEAPVQDRIIASVRRALAD
jgi:UDP-2-acetamido-2-deoxy-ribo-hexuluronate aminotransferase